MTNIRFEKEIFVLPTYEHKFFWQSRIADPLRNVKVMSREEFIVNLTFVIDDKLLVMIMKKCKVNYDIARIYAENIRFINADKTYPTKKLQFLQDLKKSLITDKIIVKNTYFIYELKQSHLILDKIYENDTEITSLLNDEGLKYSLGKEEIEEKIWNVIAFTSLEEEVRHLFIALSKLFEDGASLDKLFIAIPNNEYILTLKKYSHMYNIPLNFPPYEALKDCALTSRLLGLFAQNHDFIKTYEIIKDECSEKDLVLLEKIYQLLSPYLDAELTFHQQDDIFKAILKNAKFATSKFANGITVLRNLELVDGKIFLLGFEMGNYLRIIKDEDYLSDQEKRFTNQCSSKVSNEIAKKEIVTFLKKQDVILSYKQQSVNGIYYPSSLVNELKMNVSQTETSEIQYSEKDLAFYIAELKDQERIFEMTHPDLPSLESVLTIPYYAFKNSYRNVPIFNDNSNLKFSYSSLKTFFQCQFYYYLEKVVHVDPFSSNMATDIGGLVHKFLEESEKESFSYEETRNRLLASIEDKKCRIFAERMLDNARNVMFMNKLHKSEMISPRIYTEFNGKFLLHDKTEITGVIDKIILTGEEQQFLSLVDYKTGNEDFKKNLVPFGYSLQLPIYSLLVSADEKLKDKEIIGLYTQPIHAKEMSEYTDEATEASFNGNYLLNGITIDDVTKSRTFTGNHLLSPYIKNYRFDINNKLSRYAKIATHEELEEYRKMALAKIKEADIRIRANDFVINPKKIDAQPLPCRYCPYEDICFRENKDIVTIKSKEESEDTDDGMDS